MSEDKLDISQLREDYPFLNKIWNLYDSFNEPVGEGGNKKIYEAICNLITDKSGEDKERYNRFCLQLIRNLDPHCENPDECITYSIRCNNVNNWLYYSKDRKNINKNIIERIFNLSRTLPSRIKKFACLYYSYDENYEDPINIIRLKIFDDNMEIIEQTLKDNDPKNNTFCQNYVCECVNIYQKMNKLYCSGTNAQHGKHQKTCDMLKALKTPYDTLLSRNPGMKTKIPSLEAKQDELLAKCPLYKLQNSLPAVVDDHSGSSTSKIPATIGTMAGVSSVFALLYKLTPAGRWINTGLRGSGGRINNNLYTNGADELIIDGLEHNNFNAYNIGYEAA
ncbi:PIR protein [Plasmodium vivax]|nr:PIR protein [Plasmodium vivax]